MNTVLRIGHAAWLTSHLANRFFRRKVPNMKGCDTWLVMIL